MLSSKAFSPVVCTVMVIFILFFFTESSLSQTVKLRFSTVPFIGEAPSYVAYQKGFFKDEGLDVTLKSNPGGLMSLKDLFEGRADIITVAELPIVYSVFDKKKYTDSERGEFYIIGDMIYSQQDIQQVVARKDRGIKTPADLKGKKIGVFKGTTLRVDSIIEGMLAGQNKGLWIMAGTAMCKTETGKDSRYAPDGRQRMDPHGFHFLEYGIGAVGAAPVITVEPYDCDDFFDFTLAEGSAVYRHC